MANDTLEYFVIGMIAVSILYWAWRSYGRYRAFIWRTDDISATIERDDQFTKIGQYLNLVQDLGSGEKGWLNMKINIPESWNVRDIDVGAGLVRVTTESTGTFTLTRRNVGKLTFDILNGGDNKPDEILEAIWVKQAGD